MFVPKSIVCFRDYTWHQFRLDLGAGVVVGLVALPLAMAFAIASGLSPNHGLYTAVIAGFLISALGGSRVSIGGPTGAFVVIVAGIVHKFGYEGLAIATGMAGLILIAMGLARLGTFIKYIPYPVTTGFTSGIAVIIFSSQVKDFLGLTSDTLPSDFIEKWGALLKALPTVSPFALGIGLFTILAIRFWPKAWKIPGSVVALVLSAGAVSYFHWPVTTIASQFGEIPHGLPAAHFVLGSWEQVKALIPAAFTVATLAAVESLLCAVVADGMIGGRHKSNMELVAQGVANCLSPLFGGMPATGAIARTATNIKNGGRTPMAGMIHAVVLLVILLVAGSLAGSVPLACLAGILFVVAYHMSEWHSFKFIHKGPKSDILVLWTTFLLTVFVDLTVAVSVGLVLASFLFMKQMAELTQVKTLTRETDHALLAGMTIPEGVEIYSINGTFFFGAATKIMEIDRTFKAPKALILDMTGVLHMDATGLNVLEQIYRQCQDRKTRLMLVGVHAQSMRVLQQSGKYNEFGEDNFKGDLREALGELK